MPEGIGFGFSAFGIVAVFILAGWMPLWAALLGVVFSIVFGLLIGPAGMRHSLSSKTTYTGDRTVYVLAHKRRMPRRK